MTEDFILILKEVSEVCNIQTGEIIGKSRKENVVLARKILINICLKFGFSTIEIAKNLNRTPAGIRHLYISGLIDSEYRKIFKEGEKVIRNKLESKKPPKIKIHA